MTLSRYSLLAAVSATALIGVHASAVQIAGQDFNALDSTNTFINGAITNGGANNVGGPGLDFAMFWTDTSPSDGEGGPVASNEGADFLGVNNFSGNGAPDVNPAGIAIAEGVEHDFQFNDGDGRLSTVFETVDVSAFTGVTVSLDYWAAETTWEADDTIIFLVSDGAVSSLTSFTGTEIDAIESADDGTANWQSFSLDLTAAGVTGSNITLTVAIDNDSGSENFFIDNVSFDGVPEPASLALLSLGGLAMLRRRA